jgi:hypothetical protein
VNVHATNEDKSDDTKGTLYEELERVFDQFTQYHTNIFLGDFSAQVAREDIFKPTIGNESLHESIIDNGFRVVNCATSKKYICQKCNVHTLQN